MVLALSTCSPGSDSTVPTERIVITKVPVDIYRTVADEKDPTYGNNQPIYKVYVQLSKYMTADAGSVAMGEAVVTPDPGAQTCTVSIPLFIPDTTIPNTVPYKGTNWSNIAVVISPQWVNDIYDIDAKVKGLSGPSSSSTVTYAWGDLWSKKTMLMSSDGIESYLRLYGEKAHEDGVVVTDPQINPGADAEAKEAIRADPDVITSFDLFSDVNNN